MLNYIIYIKFKLLLGISYSYILINNTFAANDYQKSRYTIVKNRTKNVAGLCYKNGSKYKTCLQPFVQNFKKISNVRDPSWRKLKKIETGRGFLDLLNILLFDKCRQCVVLSYKMKLDKFLKIKRVIFSCSIINS